jgi:anti-sigma regulatory factor (Ser/Thr protein kinase)
MHDSGCTPDDTEPAVLMVSELVSNAILHAGGADQLIELRADHHPGFVHIEVRDHDPRPPHSEAAPVDADRGRGLVIVDRLAREWGWEPIDGNGKRVWCELAVGRR